MGSSAAGDRPVTYCEHCGLAIHEAFGGVWVHDSPEQPDRPDACFTFDDNPYSATPMTERTSVTTRTSIPPVDRRTGRPIPVEHDQAASATCVCGRNITYQGMGNWAHDPGAFPVVSAAVDATAIPVEAETCRLVRCPPDPVLRTDGKPIAGCGSTYFVPLTDIADDPDHWVDCPHCGLGFDPDHPENQPQPPEV